MFFDNAALQHQFLYKSKAYLQDQEKDATASLTGTYATGWYMPSINELCDLYKVKAEVNNSIGTTNGTQLSNNYY